MGEKWSLSQEEEDLHRQNLFRKARKGDEKAKQELQEVYGVRLWSEQERAKRNVSMSLGHLPVAFSVEPRLSTS